MKRPNAKRSESEMRYFTPELYLQFNSADAEADQANEAWENAIEVYHQHLDKLRLRLPSSVRKLADQCFHDAEVLAWHEETEALRPVPTTLPKWSAVAMLSLRHKDQITTLVYFLSERALQHPPRQDWPFSSQRPHWLYDEIDIAPGPRDAFVQRILLSDGRRLEIPFYAVVMQSFPWKDAVKEKRPRKTA